MESLRPPIPIPAKTGIAKKSGNPVLGKALPPLVVAGPVATSPGVGVGVTPAGKVTDALGSTRVGVPWTFSERLLSLRPVVVGFGVLLANIL